MESGRTFVVMKDEGILKRGMTFSLLCVEGDFIYLWAHKPIHGLNQIKFDKDVVKRNFKIIY